MDGQVQAALSSIPPVTRGLLVTLIAGYLLQLALPSLRGALGLSVGLVVTRPWTLVTSPLLVDSVFQVRRARRCLLIAVCASPATRSLA